MMLGPLPCRPATLRREHSRLWEREGPTAPLVPSTLTLIVISAGLAASFLPLLLIRKRTKFHLDALCFRI